MGKRLPRYNAQGERRCSGCDTYMSLDQFYAVATYPDGYDHYCITCRGNQTSQTYQRYRDKRNAQITAWRHANWQRYKTHDAQRCRENRVAKRLRQQREERAS